MVEENESANLMAQYEKLKADCFGFDAQLAKLNKDFVQRFDAIKKLQKELIELRSQYDKKIDAGDGKKADEILSELQRSRKKLKTLLGDIVKEGQLDDYKIRSESFNQETQKLYSEAMENWQIALKVMNQASVLTSSVFSSFNHNFIEIEQIISEAKKLNDKVFGD